MKPCSGLTVNLSLWGGEGGLMVKRIVKGAGLSRKEGRIPAKGSVVFFERVQQIRRNKDNS